MVRVYAFNGLVPVVHPDAFVHPGAVLIGDVHIGPRCYIGPCASLRGDFGRLIVKAGANLQDNCVMHGGSADTVIEENGHIGHGAILHGCHVGKGAMVGMNAVVMDGARIGAAAIVGAHSFVKKGMKVAPRSLVAGNPAAVLRRLTDEEIARRVQANLKYQQLAARSLASLQETVALTAPEPGRRRLPGEGEAAADEGYNEMVLAYRAARGTG